MSFDDPGWGSGGFDDDQSAGDQTVGWDDSQQPSEPAVPSSASAGRPGWAQPKILGAVGAVAAVLIVVLIVVLVSGGGSKKSPTTVSLEHPTTSAAVVPSAVPESQSPSPKPTHTTSKIAVHNVGETLAQYDHQADSICRRFKPRVKLADERDSLGDVVRIFGQELTLLQRLRSPDDDASQAEQWLNQVTHNYQVLSTGNVEEYEHDAIAAQTLAGQLGMKVCNFGH